jgi:hypothetical protein
MKEGILHFMYFTTGDYVRTPEGVGIVTEDEAPITEENDFCTSEIKIQHKEETSNNPSNNPIEVIRDYIIPISKEEYQNSGVLSIH